MITDDPIDIPLPQSLTPSPPQREATPVIPAPWNRLPTPEEIPLPPIRKTAPSSLDLIPLPWDIPPFPRVTPRSSLPVALLSQLLPEPRTLPQTAPSSEFPLIVSMTPSHTTPLLPKHPRTKELPAHEPTPPEWKETGYTPFTGKRKELSPEVEPQPPITPPPCRPLRPAPIRTVPLFEKHKEFVCEEGPSWKESQPSPSTGKRQESPQHVTMPLKHQQSNPPTEQSMSPEEQPTPPDSPKDTVAPIPSPSRPIAMLKCSPSMTPGSSIMSTPSSFGLGELYRTPVQTIIELKDETMEEGETTDSDSSMEEGQITDTRQSTPDSMDIGIPPVPADWLWPSSP